MVAATWQVPPEVQDALVVGSAFLAAMLLYAMVAW
jgi:hypothetical protein